MSTMEEKYQHEIDVERLWVTTEQGEYLFFSMLPIASLLVFGLWDSVNPTVLLSWFALLTTINFFRWRVLRYYHLHKSLLVTNTPKFKRLMLLGSVLSSTCWVMSMVWFLAPSDPINVLLISIALIIQTVGAMLTWFCYVPAVIVVSFPAALTLVSLLFLQGGNAYLATALMLLLLTIFGVTSSRKLAGMLNYALRLNFENAALRQESEEKSLLLETTLENMAQGICMSDQDDRLRMWNEHFIHLLGSAGAEVVANAELSDLLKRADPPIQIRSESSSDYRLQNGQVFEIRQTPLVQGGRVVTFTDISDRIKREKALQKARKEAEQANAAKTRFLAAASHDLRQPIHALGLFFAELSDRVYSPETALVIGQVEDSIASINSMLNALLDVSKLDAGVVKPSIESFALTTLFERLQGEFQAIAAENHNELRIRSTFATVHTDPSMLERMLRNLIGNALRYTQHGKILVAARPYGRNLIIQVWDTGSGIPHDQLDDIFIEFHQLQNPARDRRQGLGLGLAIVKRLAQLLNHGLKVTSNLGRGSCFSITLPLALVAPKSLSGVLTEQSIQLNDSLMGRQVLVLEDDSAVLEGMQGLLTRWGCRVMTAGSYEEAQRKLNESKQKLELLIVDYRLPGSISGIEIARQLQKRLSNPLAVIIITGDTEPERLREADASGYPLLYKPVQPAKLRSTLHYLLSKLPSDNA